MQKELERQLANGPAADAGLFHPSMSRTYRGRIGKLIQSLNQPDQMEPAKEALRGLIDEIEMQPVAGPKGKPKPKLAVDLHGHWAEGTLSLDPEY